MRRKILLVDDCELFRDLVSETLGNRGYDVTTSENGYHALAQMAAGLQPDLIITDLNMPSMDGMALIKAVRKEKDIPIFLCTSDDRLRATATGIQSVLIIDKDIDELLQAVEALRSAIDRYPER